MASVTITVGGVAHAIALPLGLDVLEDAGLTLEDALKDFRMFDGFAKNEKINGTK